MLERAGLVPSARSALRAAPQAAAATPPQASHVARLPTSSGPSGRAPQRRAEPLAREDLLVERLEPRSDERPGERVESAAASRRSHRPRRRRIVEQAVEPGFE